MIRIRFINTLLLLIFVTVPCAGCTRDDCSFASRSTAAAPVIPDGFGVNIEFTDPRPGEMKMLSEAGFRWVRMDLKWDLTEPAKGQYDFAPYDRLMSSIDQYGLHVLFILDYTNPAYDRGKPPHTDEARQAFARWA
ncbi:MAG TPA: beta-galactosidase, partial [Pyrinomonadaceae bacterium]|nr:beta-galactosidase [Pyrinomonadaceae bacterium]